MIDRACPACGRSFKSVVKLAEHTAAIPEKCDKESRGWRINQGLKKREGLKPQPAVVRSAPDADNPWSFWQLQLAGCEADDSQGPHWGFFSLREWISPEPPERKKIPVERPVAIWQDDDDWHCLITRGWGVAHLTGVMNAHEIFSRCNRDAIPHEEYLKRVEELNAGR